MNLSFKETLLNPGRDNQGLSGGETHRGNIVWSPQNEKHLHGASPTKSKTHIAIQEERAGSVASCFQHVSDE